MGGDPVSGRPPHVRPPELPPARRGRGPRSPLRMGVIAVAVVPTVALVVVLLLRPATPPGSVAGAASSFPSTQAPGATTELGLSASGSLGSTSAPTSTSSSAPAPVPTPAAPTPSPTPGVPGVELQARLDTLRKKLAIPGVSVAILWDDGRRWLGASGMADIKARAPMTTGTGFAFASISKTFTAAVILQLVEEGKLKLDQRVAPLLPEFDLDPRMTIRQLLDHTSGLPDYFLNAKIDRPLQADPGATWTVEQAWAYVKKKHPAPGNLWMYSNANYLLLGRLVEEVTGRPLAVEIRERLLDPLGLDTAWYQVVEKPRAKGAMGYRLRPTSGGGVIPSPVARRSDVMPFRSVVSAAGGAGSIAGTALDAALWMHAYAAGSVLSPATRRLQLEDVARTKALGARKPYGLGIQAVPVAGHPALGHSGRFLGFRNVARYLTDEGITIAVLTNQGVKDPAKIADALVKIILPPGPTVSP